jgi:hypothetical protein
MQPGEIRVWQRALTGRSPEVIEWAFSEYFKIGKFPPKPADIFTLIAERGEKQQYADYQPMTMDEYEAAKQDRASYFASEEYKKWLTKMQEAKKIEPTPSKISTQSHLRTP